MKQKTHKDYIVVVIIVVLILIGIVISLQYQIDKINSQPIDKIDEILSHDGLELKCVKYQTSQVPVYNLTCMYEDYDWYVVVDGVKTNVDKSHYHNWLSVTKECDKGIVINYTMTEGTVNNYCLNFNIGIKKNEFGHYWVYEGEEMKQCQLCS